MKIIIFGASGDLAKRKLFPALSKINLDNVEVIGFARTKFDKPFKEILSDFYSYDDSGFLNKIQYIQGKNYYDLENIKSYIEPDTFLYLSLPPEVYPSILAKLSEFSYGAIALEKPFGKDYSAFLEFNKFPIGKLIFVDHFLLKHLMVSWPHLISSNKKLNRFLTSEHVKTVEVIFKEEIGVEGRAYFDTHGLVKDMIQNHLAELAAVVALEPEIYSCDEKAEKRIELFKNMQVVTENTIFGQYSEYTHEMKNDSNTETFAVVTVNINNNRWKDVPFMMICGKGLSEKKTEIIIEFKNSSYKQILDILDGENHEILHIDDIQSVKLILNLAPRNEVYIRVDLENDSREYLIFSKHEIEQIMQSKYGKFENHEIVFNGFINGQVFDCVRYGEAEVLWKVFQCIIESKKHLFYYSKGTEMPKEAEKMIEEIKESRND